MGPVASMAPAAPRSAELAGGGSILERLTAASGGPGSAAAHGGGAGIGAGTRRGVRRSTVGSLPVSGSAGLANVASSVATEVARSATEEIVTQQINRAVEAGGVAGSASGAASSIASLLGGLGGSVQRVGVDEQPSGGTGGQHSEEMRQQEMLKFAASDDFQLAVIELIEDRLMNEIERRGGRYGGWFA